MLTTLIALILILSASAGRADALPVGTITGTKGTVSFRTARASEYGTLFTGREIYEGNWVKTGRDGWIELTLSDRSRFTIGNDSELEIARFALGKKERGGIFYLVQGKLRAVVARLAGRQTDIRVKSGTAVAGVKGTEFLMLAQGPANIFFGAEGTAGISGSSGEVEPLHPDTMTQNTRGYRPVTAVRVEPATPLAKARADFEAATGIVPPERWTAADALPNILARWDINHGHYLVDSGRYDEALQVFQIALDLSDLPGIRADARLERGGVFGRFLSHPEAALAEYLLVLEEYPGTPQEETALFNVGQTLYDLGRKDTARVRLRQYLEQFPAGRYRGSAETLLRLLGPVTE